MTDRAELIAWIRGEIVGPSRWISDPALVTFSGKDLNDAEGRRRGALAWLPSPADENQEILYYDRETPHRKYGAGLLHPGGAPASAQAPDMAAAEEADSMGSESADNDTASGSSDDGDDSDHADDSNLADDFDVSSPDIRHPSTMGISLCATVGANDRIVIKLPRYKWLSWQSEGETHFQLNGRYERCTRVWVGEDGKSGSQPVWRRMPAMLADAKVEITGAELRAGTVIQRAVPLPEGSPLSLRIDVYPRSLRDKADTWLLTVVLRNLSAIADNDHHECILYQTYFSVNIEGGVLMPYPESTRPFSQLDDDERSLALLYKSSKTWGIGHGCSAGWDSEPGKEPRSVFADVMPAVETPSTTPDIRDAAGNPINLSMRTLATLSDDGSGGAWKALEDLANEYRLWIDRRRQAILSLSPQLQAVAERHLNYCDECRGRITAGIEILKTNGNVRTAFRLANLAMLLQQISTKALNRRPLGWDANRVAVCPSGTLRSPWKVFENNEEGHAVGTWRAFQIAFLLMSLRGITDEKSSDRELVDLIWFPTGGGKTEAYLGVMAFYMFHERLVASPTDRMRRDGTNVLMRYTLRMLTTQQFQRAASLICAMEFLRRNPDVHKLGRVWGERFAIGLWIGGDGSPNNIANAKIEVNRFRKGGIAGNPLILTECPWCRSEIGRYEGVKPKGFKDKTNWDQARTRGITDSQLDGPRLHCSDSSCEYGQEDSALWLPVEVIDERIYRKQPSIIIATADKLAMIAYRPDSGSLFGRTKVQGERQATHWPPGLVIQDELHLISGPLGTMYGLYEAIFERLCSFQLGTQWIKPKLVASTATIRGAESQVRALYARENTRLFPPPGLDIGDSFFGNHARTADGKLSDGRLYLGIHANDYGSILTAQVRAFSSALFRPYAMDIEKRDPWWSLLAFYNSIRELGGAKTLFDSDIRSRLKFIFNRENFGAHRRNLRIVEELTSRLSQAEIVQMLDRLSQPYGTNGSGCIDACLASNIIEVGVDIDRLSIMGVVGQPKTTAQYIQVTGRIGRRWWDRAGLVLMLYNPSKSRDRSHFEQFHSYHRRLYERVEPTSATPFALSAIQRALPGALLAWARQQNTADVHEAAAYADAVESGFEIVRDRCEKVQTAQGDRQRSLAELARIRGELDHKWAMNPQEWEHFPPSIDGEYLMLWPGQYATQSQQRRGVVAASSLRQVDRGAELTITPDS